MKSTLKLTGLLSLFAIFIFSFISRPEEATAEEEAVKKLVLEAYINGAFNELDADSMEKGFHKEFSIYSAKGEELGKYPIADWVARTRQKKSGDYDPSDEKNQWKHNLEVDVTGGAAQVKVELSNQGKLIYTDYLSLLKFDSGWKIVAKVYHRHK